MIYQINETHDSHARSWVDSANTPETDFPIQNLPFGVFRRINSDATARVGVAIGDQVLDLATCSARNLFTESSDNTANALAASSLNKLMSLGHPSWMSIRRQIFHLLSDRHEGVADERNVVAEHLIPMTEIELVVPAEIGDYSDFYASVYHASNVGSMFRPDNPLLPNYKHVPIGYHGRASSIVVSGTPIRRPHGQTREGTAERPSFGPTQKLDYEMEVGCFVGPGNELGNPISIEQAAERIFGLCLVNDWSARDVQSWEYQPLGPFLAKSFSTTVSPWVITAEALAPFRTSGFARTENDPEPLPYLFSTEDQKNGGLDLTLEVFIRTHRMRAQNIDLARLSRGNLKDMYWTLAQLLAHHASNGCNLRPGDLIASGTVSGKTKESRGCLLELSWRGTEPVSLPNGEERRFLEDGDEILMRAYCECDGFARIGFGECRGRILGKDEG